MDYKSDPEPYDDEWYDEDEDKLEAIDEWTRVRNGRL